jgi:hypothetical protein
MLINYDLIFLKPTSAASTVSLTTFVAFAAFNSLLYNYVHFLAFQAHLVTLTDGLVYCCCLLQMEFEAVPIGECFVAPIAFGLSPVRLAALCMFDTNLANQNHIKINSIN